MALELTAVLRKVQRGYIGFVEELPRANATAETSSQPRTDSRTHFRKEAVVRLARRVGHCAVLFAVTACQPRAEPPVDARTAEAEIRARSQTIVAAEIRKDLETVMPFYAESAVIHMEGSPAIRGDTAIRRVYADLFGAPMTFDSAVTTDIRVARSGELAYETGVNHFTMTAGGQRTPATGKYLAVWRQRPDGVWVIESLAVTNDRSATR